MKVILTERVKSLGSVGEIVNVSAGYARNFLLPEEKAVIADEGNQSQLKHQERRLAKKVGEQKSGAVELQGKVEGLTLNLVKKVGASGKLFGTVTTNEISKELEKQGLDVERRLLVLENPIKAVGTFDVKAKLFKDVEANFKVKVDVDPKQVAEMKKKQEELELEKAAKAEAKAKAAAEAEANGETSEEDKKEDGPQTEEQRLAAEAAQILRSF